MNTQDQRNLAFCYYCNHITFLCTAIRIGFEFPFYEFPESTPSPDGIFLIKEDNRTSEQTFSVLVTVKSPVSPLLPATLQNVDPTIEFDYSLGSAGQSSVTRLFLPQFSMIPFDFSLNNDDLTEGLEGFMATSESSSSFVTTYQTPVSTFATTEIRILDDDCK